MGGGSISPATDRFSVSVRLESLWRSAEEGRDETSTQNREVETVIQARTPLQNQSRATARNKILSISLILVVSFVSLLAVRPAAATAETGYENPVTAAPQLVPPLTEYCTVTLTQAQPFPAPGGNGYDTPPTGPIHPP